jgi:hypothetical protein
MIIFREYELSRLKNVNIPPTVINNQIIQYSTAVKNLGVIFDEKFSWQQHIDCIKRKFLYSMHNLKIYQKFLPLQIKTLLVQSLLLPLLDYADVVFLDLNQDLENCLERLQNIGIRYIFNLKKFDHITDFRNKLKWLTIRQRRELHIIIQVHKTLYSASSPSYLKETFEFLASHGLPLRSNGERLLSIPTHSSTQFSKSFAVHGARCWNNLPSNLRLVDTHNILKKSLINKFLSSQ